MMRSPNYGKRTRPQHLRTVFLTDVWHQDDGGVVVTLAGPRQRPFSFPASDIGSAVTKIELIRQGAFSIPG
jgi:hypothetical protein